MWRLLSKVAAAKKSAVILTTHNMLECEAVCTRVGVMKMGELVCLGNSQVFSMVLLKIILNLIVLKHLRSIHGTGFLLELSVNSPETLTNVKEVSITYLLFQKTLCDESFVCSL